MNIQIIVPPEREGISFREVGFMIADALKKVRPSLNVRVDPWSKVFVPNIQFNPSLGFGTWDIFIFPMTVAPNATTLFAYYASPLMSKKAWYYGVVEGYPFISELHKNYLSGRVVTPSNFSKKCLEEIGVKVKTVIPHGFNPETYSFNASLVRSIVERFKGKTLLYYLSSGIRRKGIEPLLKAMQIVKKHRKDIILHLDVLPRFVDMHYQTAKKLGVDDIVVIDGDFGQMTKEMVVANLHACDLYLHPSLSEGFGMPIVEAMLCQKAPIVVDAEPMNEHVDEKCGWLVPYDHIAWENYLGIMNIKEHVFNPEDFAEAIIYALDHPEEIREKGIKAYEKAITKYHYVNCYKRFLSL